MTELYIDGQLAVLPEGFSLHLHPRILILLVVLIILWMLSFPCLPIMPYLSISIVWM